MKKIYLLIVLLLTTLHSFAQGEARNWYFGQKAGLKFEADGTVSMLTGGLIATNEGCSSMSDSNGNLLFYTDGRTVWDRNHKVMPNGNYILGTGLLGDPSSTQSAIIVPKKGDANIYYIFTVDEPHHDNANAWPNQFTGIYSDTNGGTIPADDDGFNNGLNYSVVDLSVTGTNGSIGDITTRNVPLLTYDPSVDEEARYKCSEKITAVKNSDGSGYWVLSQFLNRFYAFAVNGTGVNTTPVVTAIDPLITTQGYRRNAIGYLKASPDGQKIAIAHSQNGTDQGGNAGNGSVYLYDFDDATGTVSNPVAVSSNSSPYGLEFSQEAKKLYVSYNANNGSGSALVQYDLLRTNIAATETEISPTAQAGALQLGPDGKIYRAVPGSQFIDVINSPELDGALCDYQAQTIQVATNPNRSTLGLPPFITSFFNANIIVSGNCFGQATQLQLNVNGTVASVSWDFGDGSPADTSLTPTHTYAAAGTYNITATINNGSEISTVTAPVTIAAVPVANTAQPLVECDTDNNGVATFNLRANDAAVLGSQSSTNYNVKYYNSLANAQADTQAINAAAYTNTANPETIFARIDNKANPGCYATTSFTISVSNTPVLNGNGFILCDDASDGDDTNGLATFDMNAVTLALVQNPTQFTTTYYASNTAAQSATTGTALPALYHTTQPQQETVYARIVSNTASVCFGIFPITLKVNTLPVVISGASLTQCDLEVVPDGLTLFNLTQADSQLTAGNTDPMQVQYYLSAADAQGGTNAIGPNYTNTSNPQQVFARVINTTTGCFRVLPLTLVVNTAQVPPVTLTHCDDDGTEDGLYTFNLDDSALATGGNTVKYYASVNDALLEQNALPVSYTNTTVGNQTVYARIDDANNNCAAITELKLVVYALPQIDIDDEAVVCLNLNIPVPINAGVSGNQYQYLWSTGATSATIFVTQPGTYTVQVTNVNGCFKVRTVVVSASNVATIDDIEVHDLADVNTVTVHVSPTGGVNTVYQYSLDAPNGPYQDSNFFNDVEPGIHTVYVYDTQQCGVVKEDFAVLSIPKFFTPNGDGVNEYWRIIGVNAVTYSKSKIFIFDRYGKILADISATGPGWDGMYNGHRLPATDYWYVVQLQDGREVKGHFSLMR